MSNFGSATEAGEGFVNKLYTGIENFRVIAVCPNHAELKKMFGDKAKEDEYVLTTDEGVKQAKIVIYLDNEAEEGEPSIKTRLTYFVSKENKVSETGKDLMINQYGGNAWLPQDGSIPENMGWFNTTGMRKAYVNEPILIDFIRNLLNLPNLDKADKPEDAESSFSLQDWDAMFNGNFASLKAAIMSSPNKIGLVLGVKTTDEGKMYQDVFNRNTLRQWSKATGKFDYIRKQITEAQMAGAYPKTDFGNPDYVLREYDEANTTATNDSAFGNSSAEAQQGFFTDSTADAFASAKEGDDLAF